jgi:hypothetical protein
MGWFRNIPAKSFMWFWTISTPIGQKRKNLHFLRYVSQTVGPDTRSKPRWPVSYGFAEGCRRSGYFYVDQFLGKFCNRLRSAAQMMIITEMKGWLPLFVGLIVFGSILSVTGCSSDSGWNAGMMGVPVNSDPNAPSTSNREPPEPPQVRVW